MTKSEIIILSILGLTLCIVGLSITLFILFFPSHQPLTKIASTEDTGETGEERPGSNVTEDQKIEPISTVIKTIGDDIGLSPVSGTPSDTPPSDSTEDELELMRDIALSPDGKILAVASYTSVRFYDLETFELVNILEDYRKTATTVAWSPNGKQIALSDKDGTIRILEVATGYQLNIFEEYFLPPSNITWSPDGKQVVIGYGHDKIWWVWDTVSGEQLLHTGSQVEGAAWSPDGKQFVTANFDGKVRFWDATTGDEIKATTVYSYPVLAVAWSPDSRRIAVGGYEGPLHLWDATTGKEIYGFENQFVETSDIDWSPDGQWIVAIRLGFIKSDEPPIKMWDLTNGTSKPILENQIEIATGVEWTPDGQQLIVGGDGAIWVWDMDNNEGRRVITGYNEPIR